MTWSTADIPDLTGTTAVVTGPTRGGLGYFTALELARAGARVVLAGRSWAKLDDAAAGIREAVPGAATDKVALDLADLHAVRAGAEAIADAAFELGAPLRLLVNNAGVMAVPHRRTPDGLELQMATNHFGPFLLTGLLLPTLAESGDARVVTVSSALHRTARRAPLDYPTAPGGRYSPWGVYGQSKLANLLFTYELDRRLRAAGLPVGALAAHPGVADTHLVGNGPATRWGGLSAVLSRGAALVSQSAEAGAWPTLMAATADLPGGTYVGPGRFEAAGPPKVVSSSRVSRDRDAQRALWQLSEQTTGIAYP